jgi:hypothetical protein
VKDVAVIDGALPPSLLDGWWDRDDEHPRIENVWFENLTYRGEQLLNPIDARMLICKTGGVAFHAGSRDHTEPNWEL